MLSLPLAYTSRRKPWESLWGSSATTPLVDFHHRPTACPSYEKTSGKYPEAVEEFINLCYNYAIIEVEVKESELRYAISRSIAILKSIKYNDLVIEKYISENDLDSSETVYKIPEPKNKDESKNILEYIEEYEYKDEE